MMSRRLARTVLDSSDLSDSDGEGFPYLPLSGKKPQPKEDMNLKPATKTPQKVLKSSKPISTVRRRKLGLPSDNELLGSWEPEKGGKEIDLEDDSDKENVGQRRPGPRVQLRPRKPVLGLTVPSSPDNEDEEYVSAKEDMTLIEEVSMVDETFHSCREDEEEEVYGLEELELSESEDNDDKNDSDYQYEEEDGSPLGPPRQATRHKSSSRSRSLSTKRRGREKKNNDEDLAEALTPLNLNDEDLDVLSSLNRPDLPPPTGRSGLPSPKKLPRIPKTPHRPSSDQFWSQEFVDDWNDEHSPRKLLFPNPAKAGDQTKSKKVATDPEKMTAKQAAAATRKAKKEFDAQKHQMAEDYVAELDRVITGGKLSEMTALTGGIRIKWTKTLNKTAGRANWKSRTHTHLASPSEWKSPFGSEENYVTVTKHTATIELAEKIVSDRDRLLNTVAHEFCHLCVFMINGRDDQPHGPDFKYWARKVMDAFGQRDGIVVTTKHTYVIDFKYVWECVECFRKYNRHSKSIDPRRHRCGVEGCRGELRQIKPVPRGQGKVASAAGGSGDEGTQGTKEKKPTEYQEFMKRQMKLVRLQHEGISQKEVMKIVGARWAEHKKQGKAGAGRAKPQVTEISSAQPTTEVIDLTLDDD